MKSVRWLLTLLMCALLAGILAGYKIIEIRSAIAFAESLPEHSETVQTATTKTVSYQPTIQVMGEVVQPEHITLRNELAGSVSIIRAQSGETVRQGQVILQLDISEERAKTHSAQARLELAQLEYQRVSKLRKSNTASQAELDNARVQLQVIESELEVLDAVINKKTLKAPFNGVMGIHQLEQGSYLQPNTEIASFVGNNPWSWIEFSVPQFYDLLANGTTIDVKLAGSQSDSQQAEIIAIDPVISSSTRSYKYRARITNGKQRFSHNNSVLVTLPRAEPITLIAVPLEAVQYDEAGSYVYLLHTDSSTGGFRAERRNVVVSRQDNDRVLISDGLQAGETLAGAGAFKLHPGLLVYPETHNTHQTVSGT